MPRSEGVTLMEMMVVLIIIGITAAVVLPNFFNPTEQARALAAQNNLLAIYTAQRNYYNNNGAYCLGTSPANVGCGLTGDGMCANSVADIDCNLSLGIQDDGTYNYACAGDACTAVRNSGIDLTLTVNMDQMVQLNGEVNPSCAPGGSVLCP